MGVCVSLLYFDWLRSRDDSWSNDFDFDFDAVCCVRSALSFALCCLFVYGWALRFTIQYITRDCTREYAIWLRDCFLAAHAFFHLFLSLLSAAAAVSHCHVRTSRCDVCVRLDRWTTLLVLAQRHFSCISLVFSSAYWFSDLTFCDWHCVIRISVVAALRAFALPILSEFCANLNGCFRRRLTNSLQTHWQFQRYTRQCNSLSDNVKLQCREEFRPQFCCCTSRTVYYCFPYVSFRFVCAIHVMRKMHRCRELSATKKWRDWNRNTVVYRAFTSPSHSNGWILNEAIRFISSSLLLLLLAFIRFSIFHNSVSTARKCFMRAFCLFRYFLTFNKWRRDMRRVLSSPYRNRQSKRGHDATVNRTQNQCKIISIETQFSRFRRRSIALRCKR